MINPKRHRCPKCDRQFGFWRYASWMFLHRQGTSGDCPGCGTTLLIAPHRIYVIPMLALVALYFLVSRRIGLSLWTGAALVIGLVLLAILGSSVVRKEGGSA